MWAIAAMLLMVSTSFMTAYLIARIVHYILSDAMPEHREPLAREQDASLWHGQDAAAAQHDQDIQDEEEFVDDFEQDILDAEDEEEQNAMDQMVAAGGGGGAVGGNGNNQIGNNANGLNFPGLPLHPAAMAQQQPVAPAPLLRRDSGQSDDHDMNCLHFFALNNEFSDHISELITTEHMAQRNFEQRRLRYRSHMQQAYPASHPHSFNRNTMAALASQQKGRKHFSHTHTELLTNSLPPPNTVTTVRVSTITQSVLVPSMQLPPVRSVPLDINSRVKFHCLSPLHFAAMNASPEFIAALIRSGANINSTDMHCRTPLRLATNTRRPEIVRHLLNYPECIDLPDSEGTTALRSAVFRSDIDLVRVFLQTRTTLAHSPLEGGSDGSDGDKSSGIHSLHVSASFGNLEMIDMLVHEIGVNVDARDALGRTPLMYAATKGKWEAVEHLLKLKKVEVGGEFEEEILATTSVGAVLERSEESAVTLVGDDDLGAARNVTKMLKRAVPRADPNAQDGHGWTALHYAAVATKADPLKTIEVLTSYGASVDAKEIRYSLTPLHMAAKSGHVQILNLLIAKGANPNHRTTDNRTCLCFAAYGSHVECIKALLASNPEVIHPVLTRQKRTMSLTETGARIILDLPLMVMRFGWSLTMGYRPTIQFDNALYYPISASATLSPLHLAIRAKERSQHVIHMLIDAGADINAGIPIEVGSDWFTFAKRTFKKLTFATFSGAEAIADEEDDKIFYVNPVVFALAFGNGDVAVKLLDHPRQFCLAGLFQGMAILALAVFTNRWDVVWRTLLKTPVGVLFVLVVGGAIVVNVCQFLVPPVDLPMLKEVWASCGGAQLHHLLQATSTVKAMLLNPDSFAGGKSNEGGAVLEWLLGNLEARGTKRSGSPSPAGTPSTKDRRSFEDIYSIKKTLGQGSFAVVYLTERKSDNALFATKISDKKNKKLVESEFRSEIEVLKKVKHANLTSFTDYFETESKVYLVMELATGGELFDQIEKRGTFTENDAIAIVVQLLSAMEYLHKLGIAHRDLKPENILMKTKLDDSPISVTDFGLSKMAGDDHFLHTTCGSPIYVAPEVLKKTPGHGRPVDLWAIGVITYILLSGYTPFWGESQPDLFEAIKKGDFEFDEEHWEMISSSAKNFITRLLDLNPDTRMTATQALQHEWICADHQTRTHDLLPTVKKNFNAKQQFRKAANVILMAGRLMHSHHHVKKDGTAGSESSNGSGGGATSPAA
ncbi:calcium calmodulin-dependent protein kinase type 1G [Podochytrium sp. JEL0797]|nr:calcium calmodulin-dependent protein kinase type 1G [Podochytrium sp. JEL0797]